MSQLDKETAKARTMMAPRLRRAQEDTVVYADVDMGSKRYTMDPMITVNVHWREMTKGDNPEMRIRSFCLGTVSFELNEQYALAEKEIQLNDAQGKLESLKEVYKNFKDEKSI